MRPADRVTPRASDDRRMDVVIGRLLQAGVGLSSAFVLFGGVLFLRSHTGQPVNYKTFHSELPALRHVTSVLRGAAHGEAAALIQLGVLLLIATPVARVVVAAVWFARERDRLYVALALAVLAALVTGLVQGI